MGVIRKNRGVPSELARMTQRKHPSDFFRKREGLIAKFTDKKEKKEAKEIFFLSTAADCWFVKKSRVLRGGREEEFELPAVIEDSNMSMNGVDLSDQTIHSQL